MNNYNSYKLRKFLENALDAILDFAFYIPRKLYKENKSFKDWINNRQDKRSSKRRYKHSMNKIFYYLDRNEDGICDIALFYDYDNDIFSDITDAYDFKFLLEGDEWAKKNKLKFEKMTYEEYINANYPDYSEKLYNYRWNKHKDGIMVRISRADK